MRPLWAWTCLAAVIVMLGTVVTLFPWIMVPGTIDFEIPPEALAVQARRMVQRFGYTAPPADIASGFEYRWSYISYLQQAPRAKRKPWPAIANSQPSLIFFWYRQSPGLLEPESAVHLGAVDRQEPAEAFSGMSTVWLDPVGRLLFFSTVPPQFESTPPHAAAPDPGPLFAAAGLDLSRFKSVAPQWTPPAAADARAAWTGIFPERPENPIRIEAAWWHGRPIYFDIRGPWSKPERMDTSGYSWRNINDYLWTALDIALLLIGSLLAWRNLRLGRGDRQGAIRLAAVGFVLNLAAWALGVHPAVSPWLAHNFVHAVAESLWSGFRLWLAYVALEPFVRRRWPRTLIAWTRLLSGKWRDPLVSRDVLVGILVGLAYNFVIGLLSVMDMRYNGTPNESTELDVLLGFGHVASGVLQHILRSFEGALVLFLLFFVLRLILRKEWLAAIVFTLALSVRFLQEGPFPFAMGVVIYAGLVTVLLLYGLLPLVVAIFTLDLLINFVFTTHFAAWYGTSSITVIVLIVALALYSFRRALGPQRLLAALLEQ